MISCYVDDKMNVFLDIKMPKEMVQYVMGGVFRMVIANPASKITSPESYMNIKKIYQKLTCKDLIDSS
jgi:hypothetical protein